MKKGNSWFKKTPFQFYKIPASFYDLPKYKDLSCHAKLLYAYLLNLASLSYTNGEKWIDADGHLFVYCTMATAAEKLNCSIETSSNAMKELENAFLICRYQEGLHRAYRIILMPFDGENTYFLESDSEGLQSLDSSDCSLEDSSPNKTEQSQTEQNQTEKSIIVEK